MVIPRQGALPRQTPQRTEQLCGHLEAMPMDTHTHTHSTKAPNQESKMASLFVFFHIHRCSLSLSQRKRLLLSDCSFQSLEDLMEFSAHLGLSFNSQSNRIMHAQKQQQKSGAQQNKILIPKTFNKPIKIAICSSPRVCFDDHINCFWDQQCVNFFLHFCVFFNYELCLRCFF